MPQLRRRRFSATALGLALGAPTWLRAQVLPASADFWTLLRQGGNVLLMRHALTEPGLGDPPDFRIGDCGTQRNLSDAGRAQARRVGEAFRREGLRPDEVRSSAWCRCRDTAELAFGRHRVWSPINSFFQQGGSEQQTRDVMTGLQELEAPHNWALVTHQVNISALTGSHTAMGEVLLVRPGQLADGRLRVLARQSF